MIYKAIILLSAVLINIGCDNQVSNNYQNTTWIAGDIAMDTMVYKQGYLVDKDIYRYANIWQLKSDGKYEMIEGTLSKSIGCDTVLISLMEGGAIYKGEWSLIGDDKIICNYRMVESKLLLSEEELKEEFLKERIDTISISNSMLSLKDSIRFFPLFNIVKD